MHYHSVFHVSRLSKFPRERYSHTHCPTPTAGCTSLVSWDPSLPMTSDVCWRRVVIHGRSVTILDLLLPAQAGQITVRVPMTGNGLLSPWFIRRMYTPEGVFVSICYHGRIAVPCNQCLPVERPPPVDGDVLANYDDLTIWTFPVPRHSVFVQDRSFDKAAVDRTMHFSCELRMLGHISKVDSTLRKRSLTSSSCPTSATMSS